MQGKRQTRPPVWCLTPNMPIVIRNETAGNQFPRVQFIKSATQQTLRYLRHHLQLPTICISRKLEPKMQKKLQHRHSDTEHGHLNYFPNFLSVMISGVKEWRSGMGIENTWYGEMWQLTLGFLCWGAGFSFLWLLLVSPGGLLLGL